MNAYRLWGDRNVAAALRGEAMRVLFLLGQKLENLGLDFGRMTRRMPDGSLIVAQRIFGMDILDVIGAQGGGQKEKIIKQNWIIFLFYTPTKFKLYSLGRDQGGASISERTNLPSTFPLPYKLYDAYVNQAKDPTPAVISNRNQNYHYINKVADPLVSPAANGYDDWHFHSLYLNTAGFGDDNLRREAPTPFPTLPKIHLSISPYTAFPITALTFREGGIIQAIRQYCAEKGLYPLINPDKVVVETEVANDDLSIYGRKGYTLDASGQYATSWKEKVFVSSILNTTINSNQGTPWLGWFLFPWMPYLHEIPSFQIMRLGSDQGTSFYNIPYVSLPVRYGLSYLTANGPQMILPLWDESASFIYNEGSYASSQVPRWADIYHVIPGGPGGFYPVGQWPVSQDAGNSTFSYTLDNIGSQNNSASSSGRYISPIGALGNLKAIRIQNDFTFTQAYSRSDDNTFSKSTALPWQYYVLWSGIEEFWLANPNYPNPDGTPYTDQTTVTMNNVTTENRKLDLVQKLLFGDQEIESLNSSLSYDYEKIETGSGFREFTVHVTSHLPATASGFYDTPAGTCIRDLTTTARVTRDIQSIEVLDFDSHPNGTFIVFYKKVTITHNQNNSVIAVGSSAPAGTSRDTQIFPWCDLGIPSEFFQVNGTRKVEYFLFWQNPAGQNEKVKLAEFNSAVSGDGVSLTHTASGQRVYGVSCQVGKDRIVYHFLLETYSGTPSAPAYDSPMNFEDYSYQGGIRQWTPANIVVGCVPQTNIPNSRVQKQFGPEAAPLVYSVGYHQGTATEEEAP